MAAERIYLDWNATAPLMGAAREAMLEALLMSGNPSSVHAEGVQPGPSSRRHAARWRISSVPNRRM